MPRGSSKVNAKLVVKVYKAIVAVVDFGVIAATDIACELKTFCKEVILCKVFAHPLGQAILKLLKDKIEWGALFLALWVEYIKRTGSWWSFLAPSECDKCKLRGHDTEGHTRGLDSFINEICPARVCQLMDQLVKEGEQAGAVVEPVSDEGGGADQLVQTAGAGKLSPRKKKSRGKQSHRKKRTAMKKSLVNPKKTAVKKSPVNKQARVRK